MNRTEQKELAKQIFETLGLNVDLTGCFDKIIPQLTIEQCIQVLNLVEYEEVKSEWAYNVGKFKPENRKDVINFVTDSKYAYLWAKDIGNRDVMAHRITDSGYAYLWAKEFGDLDVMKYKIENSEDAYYWAVKYGDCDIMKYKINCSEYAYRWALKFGDIDLMKKKIETPEYAYLWALKFGDFDLMLPKVANSDFCFDFVKYYGKEAIIKYIKDNEYIRKWIQIFGEEDYFSNKLKNVSLS